MKRIQKSFEQLLIASHLIKWILLVIPVAISVGSLVALFLWLLSLSIDFRFTHTWLLFLLPVAGVVIHFLYHYAGKNAAAGNNLIMDEIHQPGGGGVPARMAPLVLITTVITHLFGGSAGREGTAVQIGGSLANVFAKLFKLNKEEVRILLMTGVAAGFGAVFGTPITGTIFAMEVLALGKIKYDALLPCFFAAVFADITCSAWGIHHTQYKISFIDGSNTLFEFIHFDLSLLLKVILAGILFGLAGYLFSELSHTIKNYSNKWIKVKWLIPVAGGVIIILFTYLLGTQDYLSLGVTNPNPAAVSIVSCFREGGATHFSWLWKILFTAITLGMGFKGGEVTPLFFIGAALGNTIATLTGAPVDLLAGLGFIAVFAGATNTPIACTMMGIELFGASNVLYYAVACFVAYYFSGHSGIYNAQRIGVSKVAALQQDTGTTLHEVREKRLSNKHDD
ncbi:MAG: voltage-gated chloride channel family protein [Bacteroidota bacterium]|nr:voltage-gated chloride channel family protein [Bacteroidota bacterium]